MVAHTHLIQSLIKQYQYIARGASKHSRKVVQCDNTSLVFVIFIPTEDNGAIFTVPLVTIL